LYLGVVTGPGSGTTFAAADTLASKAWTEFTNYAGSRKLVAFGTATTASPSVIASSAASSFTISGAGGVVAGAFLTTVASGTSGDSSPGHWQLEELTRSRGHLRLDPWTPDIEGQTFDIEGHIRYRSLRYRIHIRYRSFAHSISYIDSEGLRYRSFAHSISYIDIKGIRYRRLPPSIS
jgi:hypothetical protein